MKKSAVAEPETPNESAIEILQSGPFSLREAVGVLGNELLDSIIEQNALSAEQQLFLGDLIRESIEKRDRLGKALARIEVEEDALRKEEKRLADRRRSFERIREAVIGTLKIQLENWGVLKVEGREFTFAIKKNPAAVEIIDESKLPAECFDYKPVVVKNTVIELINSGVVGPDAARMVQRTRLEIK